MRLALRTVAEEKDYYKPDTMVNFYVKDDDLALPTTNQNASVTFTVPANGAGITGYDWVHTEGPA